MKTFPCHSYDTYTVIVSGPSYTIAEVGEILAWLGSTFRISPFSEGGCIPTAISFEIRESFLLPQCIRMPPGLRGAQRR